MKKIPINSPNKIKKALRPIGAKIKVKLTLNKNTLIVEGSEFNIYTTEKVIQAIDFGFDVEDALLLRRENFNLEFVNIKEHTHRRNLAEIRARLIGTDGKAKRTLENLTGAVLVVQGNMVGIICDAEHVSHIIQGVISLIQGAKHGNVFSYLEKQNANLKRIDEEDLGLKNPKKDLEGLE